MISFLYNTAGDLEAGIEADLHKPPKPEMNIRNFFVHLLFMCF